MNKKIYSILILFLILFFLLFILSADCNSEDPTKSITTTTTTTTIQGRVSYVTNGTVYVTCYDETNNILYIGGSFTMVMPNSGHGVPIKTSDGTPVVDLKSMPKVDGTIYCAIPDGEGGWYIGGFFTQVGTQIRNI